MSIQPHQLHQPDSPHQAQRFWVSVISRDHVDLARAGGFTQADHGRSTRLSRLRRGDGIVFYSPRTHLRSGDPVQQFTALGEIVDDEPYQVAMAPDFHPWRRAVAFAETRPADVRPLLARVGFVRDDAHWGVAFRRGLFEIPAEDFAVIREALTSG